MSFFVSNSPLVSPRTRDDYRTGFGAYLGAVAGDAWSASPASSLVRQRELMEAKYGTVKYSNDEFDYDFEYVPPETPGLSLEEQEARIREAGLAGHLEPDPENTVASLGMLMERKRDELRRADLRERAPGYYAPAGFAAGLGVAALDPLNVAAAFVPVVGEARLVNMLGRAGSAAGRAGVRAAVGAAEGALSAALVEPLVYMAKTQEQADYGMTEAMLNVGFGALFSASLRSGGGAAMDFRRGRTGRPQPWQARPQAFDTAALRDDFAARLYEARSAADPTATIEEARAAALIFDRRAHTWARDHLRGPEEYYAAYNPEFRAGVASEEGAESVLLQAAKQILYSDDRSVKITFEETGVTPSLSDRSQLRKYLDSLEPQLVARLRSEDPEKYIGIIRSIARKILSKKDGLLLRREGRVVDYAHFAGRDAVRDGYLPTLLSTIKDQDVKVEFATPQGEAKAYYIKKYFDPEVQKDIWDMLVITDNEIKTKIARKGRKGAGYAESQILGAGNEASRSATPDGAMENAPTRLGNTGDNINPSGGGVNEGTLPQPAYLGGRPRASVAFAEDGRAVISFFKNSDPSSAIHEIYHVFRRELAESAALASAPDGVRADWAAIESFVGAKSGEKWTPQMEERFAEAAERYIMRGEAPSPELAGVFARLRQWLIDIYRGFKDMGEEVSPQMRDVFDRMLDADSASDEALSLLLNGIEANPESARIRAAYAALTPDERQDVFRAAVGQARSGRKIDVEALVMRDNEALARNFEAELSDEPRAALVRENAEAARQPKAEPADTSPIIEEKVAAAERMDDALSNLERSAPDEAGRYAAEAEAELKAHDEELARIETEEQILLAAAACDARR